MQDLNILLKDASRVHGTTFTHNDFDCDPQEYINKAIKKYGGKTFIIKGGADGSEEREVYVPTEEELS